VVIRRGDVCRAGTGDRRPVLVIQAQPYNDSRLPTVLAASITANTRLATMPGSVFLTKAVSGLDRDAVVDVTTLLTLSRSDLGDPVGTVPPAEMADVDAGLRQVLGL
jgi:mRNA interferase MazF